jgi:hypothetical protein
MAQTFATPALFEPHSVTVEQVLEHQVPFTHAPDAHSPFTEQGSPSFFTPVEELPELANVPELAEVPELAVPELAALPELPPEPPVHSDAQLASTHVSAAFASELVDCSMHDWQDVGHVSDVAQALSTDAHVPSALQARAASQHFCAMHCVHGEVEVVVHWFALDPPLDPAPLLEPDPPAPPDPLLVEPEPPLVEPPLVEPGPPAFPIPESPPRAPPPSPPPPEPELHPMAAEPMTANIALAKPNLIFTWISSSKSANSSRRTNPQNSRSVP